MRSVNVKDERQPMALRHRWGLDRATSSLAGFHPEN